MGNITDLLVAGGVTLAALALVRVVKAWSDRRFSPVAFAVFLSGTAILVFVQAGLGRLLTWDEIVIAFVQVFARVVY